MSIDRIAPSRRPPGRPAGFQRWRKLLFLHWEVSPSVLRTRLPAELAIDTWEGRAWVGLVAFTMRDVSPWWSPPLPGVSHFHELNLRTYVLCGEVPGVWFFSLEAAASLAVVVARTGWNLPYHRASMELREHDGVVHYTSRRRWPGPTPADFEARYRTGDERGVAEPESRDHFLVERYVLYTQDGSGRLLRGSVHHEPYPLRDAALEQVRESLVAAAGLEKQPGEPLIHYSPGVDVDVYALEPVS